MSAEPKVLQERRIALTPLKTNGSFHGFANDEFRPTLLSALSLSAAGLVLQSFPLPLGGFMGFLLCLFTYKWYHLHGMKLTRKEIVFFDENGLLEINEGCDYNNPLAEDSATPAAGPPDVQIKSGPTTIWEALFCDENELNMQKFYKGHYGPVWSKARKGWKESEELTRNKSGK